MKKLLTFGLAMTMAMGALTGCGGSDTQTDDTADTAGAITVVSREDGSGTRGAFIELFGIEEKNEAGEKVDMTTDMAEITNSTAVMMTTVAGNPAAIGYVSLGSLDDSVKVLEIDGVQATVDNIKNGTYAVARPFNIATGAEVSEAAQDFVSYIMSADGQQIIIGIQPPTGEKAKTKPFLPNSEQFANHTLYSYFLNPNVNSQQANVGFALIDEDNNIIRVLKDAGLMTLKGGMSEYKYIALNLDTETTTLTEGTYRIGTVCRLKGSVRWTRVGYRQRYFLVTKGANNQVTDIQLYPKNDFEVTDLKCTGNLVAGVKQNVTASLINGNEETNAAAYLFASPTTSKGEAQSRATILLKKNETTDLFMAFTPETYGQYNLWLSTDGEGKNVLTTKQVNIIPAPTEPANLTMLSCVPNTTEVSATVRIKNNSTEGYYREIVAILFENLYNDGKLYGTEVLTLPGDIASGSTKTFKFQFHGADSYSQCAILIGYYANHQDANYKQLGNYVWFTTEETPVESINGTPVQDAPIYRIDGTKVSKPIHEGIYISNGKALIAK